MNKSSDAGGLHILGQNVMNHVELIISCVVVRVVKVILVHPDFILSLQDNLMRIFASDRLGDDHAENGHERRRSDRTSVGYTSY